MVPVRSKGNECVIFPGLNTDAEREFCCVTRHSAVVPLLLNMDIANQAFQVLMVLREDTCATQRSNREKYSFIRIMR